MKADDFQCAIGELDMIVAKYDALGFHNSGYFFAAAIEPLGHGVYVMPYGYTD